MLMIGNVIIKGSDTLKSKYFEELKKIEDVKDGLLEESSIHSNQSSSKVSIGAKMGAGSSFLSILKASVDFESSYKINEEIRVDARRLFKIRRKELIDLTNAIILEYKIENNDKDLLVVIDDLEKKDKIDKLFLQDMSLLNELNIVKVITMPIHLHRTENFFNSDVREFGLKLTTLDGDENTKDKGFLKDIISKRIEKNDLISEDAITQAILYSGANLRQLIRLIL